MSSDLTRETTTDGAELAQPTYSVRAVERTLDILDALAREPEGLALSALAKHVSMPRSSMFRYLSILEGRRYVIREAASGNYELGLAIRFV